MQKWNSCFLRFFKLAKNEIHVFWGFLSLQKMKFMFFQVFKVCKKWNSCFLRFFLYYKKRTSFVVSTEFSSIFKNKMKTTTSTRSAFFLCTAVIHTTFTTHTVSRNMPKTGKKKQLWTYFFINKKEKLLFHFFQKVPRARI